MKLWIGLVIAFAVLVFVDNIIKNKKRRNSHLDTTIEFKKRYHQNRRGKQDICEDRNQSNYVTKYNSRLDYVEKDKFT